MSAYKKKAHPKHKEAEKSQLLFSHSSDVDVSAHTSRNVHSFNPRSTNSVSRTYRAWSTKLSVGGRGLLVLLQARSCSKAPLWAGLLFVGLL